MLLFRMSEGSSNGTKMDEWTPKVVYNLGKFFEEENVKRFRNLLKETEALVTSETQVQDNRIHMAIIGKPNAGKSTLLNALMKKTVSKVESIPGTTRDYIIGEFTMDRKKYVVYDTAGIRKK